METDWRVKKASLQESLGHIFETGSFADAAFLVGPEGFRINVHKFILSARSEPFAAMFHDRWTPNIPEEIKIPENNKSAFKPFLNYLYTDVISFKELKIQDILEITHLAHMYQVDLLFKECIHFLSENIDESNCLQIYQLFKILDQKLSLKALRKLIANVIAIAKLNNAYLTWDADLVEKILRYGRNDGNERTLFKALLRWNYHDPARNVYFKKFLKFIIFPVTGTRYSAPEFVNPGVLSQAERLDVLCYLSEGKEDLRENIISSDLRLKCIQISDAFITVQGQELLQMPQDFPKLRISTKPTSLMLWPELYGVKLFPPQPPDCNLESVLSHLKRPDFGITVYCFNRHNTIISVSFKTIAELEKQEHRVYFRSPLNLFNKDISIAVKLGAEPRDTMILSRFPVQLGRLPENLSNIKVATSGGESFSFEFNIIQGPFQGDYCLIHELLFTPPERPEPFNDNGECLIS